MERERLSCGTGTVYNVAADMRAACPGSSTRRSQVSVVILHTLLMPQLTSAELRLTLKGVAQHPTVYITPVDAQRARKRIKTDPDAKAWFQSILRSVAPWDDKDAAWVKRVMPERSACFAYGFTGCPICGARWGTWGSVSASFDNPRHVQCANGHILPDEKHPDPGTGYVGQDGRTHYFVGSYNAWVVETLTFKIAEPYANVHLLTGDRRAGRMAAVILDEIARIYPSCEKGSWDYPSNPPSGRLNRPWYQVARVLIHYVDIYDRIHEHPALDEPSGAAGLTRRQNIERNLLLNGAKYCYEQSVKTAALHNGQADYLRGVLAVGAVLGIPEYVKWAVDGTYGIKTMLANNVDRDGRYFETSASYGLHTRNLYLSFAEPLLNHRGSDFPEGLNLYDEPKFESFLLLPQMALVCLGHEVPFGDMNPATYQRTRPYNPPIIKDCRYAEYLAVRVSDAAKRAQYARLLAHLQVRDPDGKKRINDMVEWRVFHKPDTHPVETPALSDRIKRLLDGSVLFGQKGLAILRQGSEGLAQGAVLRFGPSLVHGHLDDLNVNYFSQGYEATYDIGYALGSTHTQVGWAKQTISHNTVVVNERSQGGGAFGGSVHHFAELPGLALADASSTAYAHAGVDVYRRLIALTDGYAVDVFRVRGGSKHDLPLHSLGTRVEFDGLTFGKPRPGSLAGREHKWGELQLNDGDMKGYPNKPYWNPPPGNGYGFLVQPALGQASKSWAATWLVEDKANTRFQLLALHDPESQVVTAVAPGLYPHFPKARYVIRRRTGDELSSCFFSLWQTSMDANAFAGQSIRRIDAGPALSATSGLAISVSLGDGKRDIWAFALEPDATIAARDEDTEILFKGVFAKCRVEGDELLSAHLLKAHNLNVAGWTIALDAPARCASIAGLPEGSTLRIDNEWPEDARYVGNPLYVTGPRYSRDSSYTISDGAKNRIRLEQADTILGRGTVHKVRDAETLTTFVPHEYARSVTRRGPTGFFCGKLLRSDDGSASTHIRDIVFGNPMTIRVESTTGFKAGQAFYYHDVQPGDRATVHHHAALVRVRPRVYRLITNTDVTLSAPGNARIQYLDRGNECRIAAEGRIPRDSLPRAGHTTVRLLN